MEKEIILKKSDKLPVGMKVTFQMEDNATGSNASITCEYLYEVKAYDDMCIKLVQVHFRIQSSTEDLNEIK